MACIKKEWKKNKKIIITEKPILTKNKQELVSRSFEYEGSPGDIVSMLSAFIKHYCDQFNKPAKDMIVFIESMLDAAGDTLNIEPSIDNKSNDD